MAECYSSVTGWQHCVTSMIDTLTNCVYLYHTFMENENMRARKAKSGDDVSKCRKNERDGNSELTSFLEIFRNKFKLA